jgi:hypothetical protein
MVLEIKVAAADLSTPSTLQFSYCEKREKSKTPVLVGPNH